MTFLGDEGRDALVMRNIVLGRHFPLIGPGTSIGNMYLGPLYYYLVAPSLLISGFSPLGPAVEVAVIGILTVGLLWWIGRQWFGPFGALLISALYAVSPVVITYSRSSWNPNIMPFFALLTIYSLWQVWRNHRWPWLIVSAVAFAFVLNSHYLGLLLAPTIGIFWLITAKKSLKTSIVSFLLLLLLLSPLLIFDMRHNWTNFNALKAFLTDRQQTVNFKAYKAIPNLWPIWADINTTLLAAGNIQLGFITSALLVLLPVLILVKQLKSKNISPELMLVMVWIGFGLLGLGLYKQHIYAHYYGFIFPAPFLLLGSIFKYSHRLLKYLLAGFILFLLLFNLINNPFRSSPNLQLERTSQIALVINQQALGQPFNLALIAKTNYDAGYRYALQLLDSPYFTIHDQLAEQLFVICEIDCEPINNPLWEVAAFGWAKIDKIWEFPWGGVKLYRLIHNPSGS